MQSFTSPGVRVFLQPNIGWRQTKAPPKPEGPSAISWVALDKEPNCLNPAKALVEANKKIC
jgi:hypothetical protein